MKHLTFFNFNSKNNSDNESDSESDNESDNDKNINYDQFYLNNKNLIICISRSTCSKPSLYPARYSAS